MTEQSETGPTDIDLVRRVRETRVFLRMAAIELHRIAEQAPEIAFGLRHVALKLDAEAEDLAARETEPSARSSGGATQRQAMSDRIRQPTQEPSSGHTPSGKGGA